MPDCVGDIRYSILRPEVFTKLNPGWELMGGQAIQTNWDLYQLLQRENLLNDGLYSIIKNNLPDARGVFLRGMNYQIGNDSGKNPENKVVGEYQPDAFEDHAHWYLRFDGGVVNDFSNDKDQRKANFGNVLQTSTSGAIANNHGSETRPRNIPIYVYIKVNQ